MKTISEKSGSGARRGDGWFSSGTAWKADHFADTQWAPCLLAVAGSTGLTVFAQSGLAGGYDRLLTLIGVVGLALSLRVLIGKLTAGGARR